MNPITQPNVALQQVASLQHLFELNIQKGNCIDDSVHLLDQMKTIAPHTGVEHDVMKNVVNNYITLLHVHGIQSSDESLQYIHNLDFAKPLLQKVPVKKTVSKTWSKAEHGVVHDRPLKKVWYFLTLLTLWPLMGLYFLSYILRKLSVGEKPKKRKVGYFRLM